MYWKIKHLWLLNGEPIKRHYERIKYLLDYTMVFCISQILREGIARIVRTYSEFWTIAKMSAVEGVIIIGFEKLSNGNIFVALIHFHDD